MHFFFFNILTLNGIYLCLLFFFCNLVLFSVGVLCVFSFKLLLCAHSWNWWYSFCVRVCANVFPLFSQLCYVFLVHWTYFSILYYLYYHRDEEKKLSFFFLFRCVQFFFYRSFHFSIYISVELVIKRNYILRMMKSVKDRKRCMAIFGLKCAIVSANLSSNTAHDSTLLRWI